MKALKWTLVIGAAVLLIAGVGAAGWFSTDSSPKGPPCAVAVGSENTPLTREQAHNATTIAAVARKLGMPNRAVTVALATAFQESHLANIDYGDRDSVGLFQQRPSQGWGTRSQIMVPRYAATKFFEHLNTVEGWQQMSVNDAAQAVQRSGHPTKYEQWEAPARLIARSLTGEEPGTFTCRPASAKENQTSTTTAASLDEVDRAIVEAFGGKHISATVADQRGWSITCWLIARSDAFAIDRIDLGDKAWTRNGSSWQSAMRNQSNLRIAQASS